MIRTKGEPGTGDVIQAVTHMRSMMSEIRRIQSLADDELLDEAKKLQVPVDLLQYVHDNGKPPVVNFAAGGIAPPADAALMMQLGAEGVFVGSGIFKYIGMESVASSSRPALPAEHPAYGGKEKVVHHVIQDFKFAYVMSAKIQHQKALAK